MKILLVEDDQFLCELIKGQMLKHGHQITITHDGDSALGIYKEILPDIIITDILMPDKEGIELIQDIRNIDSKVMILAISSGTSSGWSPFLKLAETVGANATLMKPFSTTELIEKIDELIDAHLVKGCIA